MSRLKYEGEDGDKFFFLTVRNIPKDAIDGLPVVTEMKKTLDASIVGRDCTDKTKPATSHRRWFPAVFKLGEEHIQVASIYAFDGFFALTCKVLDGDHDSKEIELWVEGVNDRAHRQ